MQGEEEVGSPNLANYLNRFSDCFKCNGIIWEVGYFYTQCRPIINLGLKGTLYVELFCQGPATDIRSGLATIVNNPAWRLIKALDSILHDSTGKILMQVWLTRLEILVVENFLPLISTSSGRNRIQESYKINNYLEILNRRKSRRQHNIYDIISGYSGRGAKTIVTSFAKSKIDFRLVRQLHTGNYASHPFVNHVKESARKALLQN